MKKIILTLAFSLLQVSALFSQNHLFVTYKTNIMNSQTRATLIASKTISVYEEGSGKEEYDSEETMSNSFIIGSWIHSIIYQNLQQPNIIKIKQFKSDDPHINLQKDYYITDSIPVLDWKIYETKDLIEIQGFKCKEATVQFRGSRFKAYFTTEIPTLFGPWKFNGLPGLILKVSSLDNPLIYWEAEKVIYPYTEQKEPITPDETLFTTSMKEYIQERDDLSEKKGRAFAAKNGGTYHPIPKNMRRDKSRERKYEWETW